MASPPPPCPPPFPRWSTATATTYSVDVDKDGLGGANVPKYAYAENDSRLLAMASEQLEGKGLIVVSGAAFMSNFEVQATISDNGAEKNYSNYQHLREPASVSINPVKITDHRHGPGSRPRPATSTPLRAS